jgi:hypothetical protein
MCRRRSISAEEMIGQQGEEHDIQDDDQEKSDLGLHQHRCLRWSGRSAVTFAALQGSASAKAPNSRPLDAAAFFLPRGQEIKGVQASRRRGYQDR